VLVVAGLALQAGAAVIITVDTTPTQGTNLTTEGTADWVQVGRPASTRNEKFGAAYIGDIVRINATLADWNPDYNLDWSDGTPTLIGNDVDTSWEAKPAASGNPSFDFDVTGPAGQYQMIVYGTLYLGDGTFTASVSGGGPSDSVTVDSDTASLPGNRVSYAVDFDLATGEHLDVTYELTEHPNANSNVGLAAVTLVPEPATLGLLALGGMVLAGRRRR